MLAPITEERAHAVPDFPFALPAAADFDKLDGGAIAETFGFADLVFALALSGRHRLKGHRCVCSNGRGQRLCSVDYRQRSIILRGSAQALLAAPVINGQGQRSGVDLLVFRIIARALPAFCVARF
jgi:hypothetical protein